MNNKKTVKIASKVTMKIAIALVIVFVAITVIIQLSIKNDLVKREQEKLLLLANQNASISREFMEAMSNQQSVLVNTITSLNELEDMEKVEALNRIISKTKDEEKNALSIFYIAEPNTFIKEAPNGFSFFATDGEIMSGWEMFRYVDQKLYDQVKQSKKMAVVDPYTKKINGVDYMVVSVILPVLNEQGEFIGIVGSDIDTNLLNNAGYNEGGFSSFTMQIICGHQTVISNNRNPEFIGKPYLEVSDSKNSQMILDSAKSEEPLTFIDENIDGVNYYKSYVPFYLKGSDVVWLSGTSITKAEFDANIFKQVASIVVCLVLALFALTLIIYFVIKRSLRPIQGLNQAIKALSQGNLHYELDYESNDEFGSLAESFKTSTTTLYSYVTDIDRAMAEMARGNFDIGASQPFIGDFQNIEISISKFLATMSDTLLQIKNAAEQVSGGSSQVSDSAQALAQNATEQASSVELLTLEIVGISEQIKNTADSAAGVNQLAGVVGDNIQASNKQMSEMGAAMSEISRSSEEISKIIKTIEDIAFQTNILALNAAVEAARAGSAGKGFAVVADEVRNLSTKSSEAAKQTSALIEESVSSVKKGVQIAKDTALSLVDVVTGAEEITNLIGEISQASALQTESIAQIKLGVEQISYVVQTNSATSEESAAASEELSSQSEMMKSLVSQFKLKSE